MTNRERIQKYTKEKMNHINLVGTTIVISMLNTVLLYTTKHDTFFFVSVTFQLVSLTLLLRIPIRPLFTEVYTEEYRVPPSTDTI
jgi:hypothetical protein